MLWKSTHTLHNHSAPSRPNLRRYNIIIVSEGGFSFEWTYTHIILCCVYICIACVRYICSVLPLPPAKNVDQMFDKHYNVYIKLWVYSHTIRNFFDNSLNIFEYSPPIHLIFFEPITHCNKLLKLKYFETIYYIITLKGPN